MISSELGKADYVAIGRSLFADPDWPKKAEDGCLDRIRNCIACNEGCISRLFAQQDVWCTVNPDRAPRMSLQSHSPKIKSGCSLLAGGPAGMEAARIASHEGLQGSAFRAA